LSQLSLRLLGAPSIDLDGHALQTERRKAIALLAYLAISDVPHRRDALAALLWPDYDQRSALTYLRRTLWELNQALGDGWLVSEAETIGLVDAGVWVDARELSILAQALQDRQAPATDLPALENALQLYRDHFLAGFSLRDSPAFDDWQSFTAESMRSAFAVVAAALCQAYLSQGQYAPAIEVARRWAALDRYSENASRMLMELFARAGQRGAALRHYQQLSETLLQEIGVKPEAETQALYRRIKAGELSTAPVAASTPSGAPPPIPGPPSNLPSQATPFIGRTHEQRQIIDQLAQPECRLLTLLGPGGIGKTRLGVQIGEHLIDDYANGVFFVPLATWAAPEAILPAIASAVGLAIRLDETTSAPLTDLQTQLADYLRDKRLLLILDNFEHLMAGATLLPSLLHAAPRLKLLVTSRQRLNLYEEWVFEVPGMRYPAQPAAPGAADYSAVRLFLECAGRARVGFHPADDDLAAIAHICRLLEGSPLGIELAASWTRLLSPGEILAQINTSLDFLETALRDLPQRHRSLRAVFEHSWSLLNPAEQRVFQNLSVFSRGFSLAAAQAVGNASLPLLTALIDQSLLRRDAAGRYDLHELLKQYAAEKLAGDPSEHQALVTAHYRYYFGLLVSLNEQLKGPEPHLGLRAIAAETGNLQVAWANAIRARDWRALRQVVIPLYFFHQLSGSHREAVSAFTALVDALHALPQDDLVGLSSLDALAMGARAFFSYALERTAGADHTRSLALVQQAIARAAQLSEPLDRALACLIVDFGRGALPLDQQTDLLHASLEAFEAAGEQWAAGLAWIIHGEMALYEERQIHKAAASFQRSLEIFTRLDSRWFATYAQHGLLPVYFGLGDYHETEALARQCTTVYDEMGQQWMAVNSRIYLGQALVAQGKYQPAIEYYKSSLGFLYESGDRWNIGVHDQCLGYACLLNGDLADAEQYYEESLEIYSQLADQHGIGMAWSNLGDVARRRRDHALALERYHTGYQLLAGIGALWAMSVCMKKIGQVEWELGNAQSARSYLGQALDLGLRLDRTPEIIEVLASLALTFFESGETTLAQHILEVGSLHPATAEDIRRLVQDELRARDLPLPRTADWPDLDSSLLELARLAQQKCATP
jgi:predicted ATPase/DNA-binding SARP family transcriptional activator